MITPTILVRRHLLILLLVATLGLSPLSLPAQGPGQQSKDVSVSSVERKNLAPVSKDVLRVNIPKPFEAKLENGLTVLILEDHRAPLVAVSLNISGAGGVYDPPDLRGLATTTATMMREGTQSRDSRHLAEQIALLGASVNVSSGFGSAASQLSASGLTDNMDDWMTVALDVLFNPSFPADELARWKQRQLVQLRNLRSNSGFLAAERFNRVVYGDHPSSVIMITPEAVNAVTPERMAAWHHERFVPQNAILAIVGDVKASELMPKIRQWFGGWKRTDLQEVLPPNPKPATQKKVYLVDRSASVQTTLRMGNIAIDRKSPDFIALTVMNRILGGGPASRLFINLREEKGYTYGVGSSFSQVKWTGPWQASSSVRTEVTEGAMKEFLYELNRIRNEKVTAQELDEAKRAIVGSFARDLESQGTLLNYAMVRKIYGLPADYWDRYPAQISAITADDVQRVARKYINPETMQVVAVGDASKIKAVLEKYGPVELYDTDGKPVTSGASSGSNR
ncbi:MAG TPA: pitrilysin family protein [Candidatus Acidoferrales bacterium]